MTGQTCRIDSEIRRTAWELVVSFWPPLIRHYSRTEIDFIDSRDKHSWHITVRHFSYSESLCLRFLETSRTEAKGNLCSASLFKKHGEETYEKLCDLLALSFQQSFTRLLFILLDDHLPGFYFQIIHDRRGKHRRPRRKRRGCKVVDEWSRHELGDTKLRRDWNAQNWAYAVYASNIENVDGVAYVDVRVDRVDESWYTRRNRD